MKNLPILLVAMLVVACAQPIGVSDEQRLIIRAEVEATILRIYEKNFPALDYKSTIATSAKSGYIFVNGQSFPSDGEVAEKEAADFYGQLKKREAKIDGMQTHVLSANSALTTFRVKVTDVLKERDSVLTETALTTFVMILEDGKWKMKHGHFSEVKNPE